MIIECLIVVIAVQGIQLAIKVGNEQVHEAVLIVISGVHAHSRPRSAFGAIRYPGGLADFLKFAVSAVKKQKVCDRVIGDEQIHKTIIIYVSRDHAPGFSQTAGDSRRFADIRKGAIAVVMK